MEEKLVFAQDSLPLSII
uniref:Uncharacterized protein n=1 Tax=Arundo donax TaxID=35708 RepID=A0A0A8Y4R5_ARUDO